MRKSEIDDLLGAMLESHDNVSDLNITCDRPLQVESSGELVAVPVDPPIENMTPFQTEIFALNLINGDRRLTEILITGATGSGKTTSLAALLSEINATKSVHVVTLEDPVEYVHPNRKSTFNQRELGLDYDSFASGLRAALRQAPKIILVGEMRDRETAELALKASETGHLVLSTLHTVNAGQAISRIVGMFDQEEEKQIRQRLAETVRWVVGQRLVPKVGGGRWAVHDILANTIRTNELIVNGESEGKTFYDVQDVGEPYLMTTFDEALLRSYQHGIVTEETAIAYSSRKSVVQRGLDQIKQKRGEKTSDVEGLRLDADYNRRMGIKR